MYSLLQLYYHYRMQKRIWLSFPKLIILVEYKYLEARVTTTLHLWFSRPSLPFNRCELSSALTWWGTFLAWRSSNLKRSQRIGRSVNGGLVKALRYVGTYAVHSAPARLDPRDTGYRQWQRRLRCHRDISTTLRGQPHYKDRLAKITRRQKIGRYGVVRLEIGGTASSKVYIIRAEFHQQTLRPMMSLVLPNCAQVSVSL